jgi:hypothetical protein
VSPITTSTRGYFQLLMFKKTIIARFNCFVKYQFQAEQERFKRPILFTGKPGSNRVSSSVDLLLHLFVFILVPKCSSFHWRNREDSNLHILSDEPSSNRWQYQLCLLFHNSIYYSRMLLFCQVLLSTSFIY